MHQSPTYKRAFFQTILSLLVLLMVYAAASKGLAFTKFATQLSKSPLFGSWYKLAAVLILVAELIAASLLLFPRTQRIGLWACALLLTVFTLYIMGMLLLSPKLPCSCGGIIERLGWKGHIVFNLSALAISLYALYLHRTGEV